MIVSCTHSWWFYSCWISLFDVNWWQKWKTSWFWVNLCLLINWGLKWSLTFFSLSVWPNIATSKLPWTWTHLVPIHSAWIKLWTHTRCFVIFFGTPFFRWTVRWKVWNFLFLLKWGSHSCSIWGDIWFVIAVLFQAVRVLPWWWHFEKSVTVHLIKFFLGWSTNI